jgi:lipoic acid synthetase
MIINRLPVWFRQGIVEDSVFAVLERVSQSNLHTVCQKAHCPNLNSCFKRKEITFMILGDTCTRSCSFCAVSKVNDKSFLLDQDEPRRLKDLVRDLGLDYIVITSVTRDDLSDGGAGIFAESIRQLRALNKGILTEALIPDFKGDGLSLKKVIASKPDVIAHNLETVGRLYKELKPDSDYRRSLDLLRIVKGSDSGMITKSSLMLGLGEKEDEVIAAMHDLKNVDCDILTLGQYLSPSARHYPVRNFISPEEFQEYRRIALDLGFKAVASGPLVRSSYRAKELYTAYTQRNCFHPNRETVSESIGTVG